MQHAPQIVVRKSRQPVPVAEEDRYFGGQDGYTDVDQQQDGRDARKKASQDQHSESNPDYAHERSHNMRSRVDGSGQTHLEFP